MHSIDPDEFETRPARKRIGFFLPALIIIGVAATLLIFLLTMRGIGWQPPFIEQGPDGVPVLLSGAASTSGTPVLYISPSTKAHLAKVGGNYDVLLNPWRNYFSGRKIKLKEIDNPQALAELERGILILPSAVALDDGERLSIKRFREKGGGILATWATGSRDGQGRWVGWDFMASLGSKVVGEVPAEPVAGHLILNGESPVSNTHPAGFRIWLGKPAEPHLRMQPVLPEAQIAGRIMNWARIPMPERAGEGALIFSETSPVAGRAVVMGFAETAWDASSIGIHILLDDTFNWLSRKPNLVQANWPDGRRSAQIVEMDTEEGFQNALRFASVMNAANYRGSFYLLSSVAKQFPDVVQALGRDFELGYHGDVHTSFKGVEASEQQVRLQAMRNELASVYSDTSHLSGFRAPTEGYDQTTEELLIKAGVRYHLADPSRSESRLPLLVHKEGVLAHNSFVVLPRTQRDDLNFAQEGITGERLLEALDNDLALGIDMAALGLLSIHSQNYGADSPLGAVMPTYLGKLTKRPDVWPASGGEVADWWRDKERFRLKIRNFGARIEFDISILGSSPFKKGALVVVLPAKNFTPFVQQVKTNMPKPRVEPLDAYRSLIIFDELEPGNYNYQLTFSR